ncbi:MAG TPA: Uma2 family endonuclease [Thermomicrobiales bacterium]|nr:Uma2 family endonuclease [Thermomicrobiales bacterium]
MSLQEYRALEEFEGLRIEWVNGEAIVFMPPLWRHIQVTSFLVGILQPFVNLLDLGGVYFEHLGVELPGSSSIRLPDVVVVLKDHFHRMQREGLVGAADFIAEVLSLDSTTRDRRDKYLEYQTAGVAEYLVFDGREGRFGFWFYRLDQDGRYQLVQPDERGRYHSEVLPGLWFDPRWFEQDPLPNPLHLLKEIAPDAWRRFVGE